MNLNIIGYILYLGISIAIVLKVGKTCYTNGDTFITNLLKFDIELAKRINQMLLIGYYLLNIGYAAITVISWKQIESHPELIEVLMGKLSLIILTIGILHYINIFIINKYVQKLLKL